MAALGMAKQAHKQISIRKGDTVIMRLLQFRVMKYLYRKLLTCYLELELKLFIMVKEKFTFQGHGSQEELKLMLNLMKPKYFVPVHGEFRMQKACILAEDVGIARKYIFIVEKAM